VRSHHGTKIPDAIGVYGSFVELPNETDQLTFVVHAATSVRIWLLFYQHNVGISNEGRHPVG
jgi:hypothetical protein